MNQGQTDSQAGFLARGAGYTLFLTKQGTVLSLLQAEPRENNSESALPGWLDRTARRPVPDVVAVLGLRLAHANANAQAHGMDELPGKSNYFLGNNPQQWHSGVPNYARVKYEAVYPGVDLIYYGNQGRLEYDFVVSPGASVEPIEWNIEGADRDSVDVASGDLVLAIGGQEVRFHQPVAYTTGANGEKRPVAAHYAVDKQHRVRFAVGPYDNSRPLVIDPTLSYSTYLGGRANDYGDALALDSAGNAYVIGYTSSTNFPSTAGVYQPHCANNCSYADVFVTEINASQTNLVYSTYLGGSRDDFGYGIFVDASGNAYLTGQTFSADFPTTSGAFQTACGGGVCTGGEGFVTKLNSTGSALIYSTYLAGSTINLANAIVVDNAGDAYVTGWTDSTDFPTTAGVVQPTCSCSTYPDAFLTKLNSGGTGLVYSTYLGGPSNGDYSYSVAVDSLGNAYLGGYTASTDFPVTAGAYQTTLPAVTAGFISKLNSTATALVYSTFLGGHGTLTSPCGACVSAIAVDSAGDVFAGGLAWTTNFPTTAGAFQTAYAGGFHDAFVTKLNPQGNGLIFSTYLGGTDDDGLTSLAIDSSGNVYLRGNTFSVNFPTSPGAFQTSNGGGSDAWVAVLDSSGSKLNYSSYLGGSGNEYGLANQNIAIDSAVPPNIYVTGYTNSTNFPTSTFAYKKTLSGANDAFVSKFAPSPNVGLSPPLNFGNQTTGTNSSPMVVTVTNTGNQSLSITGLNIGGTSPKDYSQTNNCLATLSPGGTCNVNLVFTPSVTGVRNATLSFSDNAYNTPQSLNLTGIGVVAGGPAVTISTTALTYAVQQVNTVSPSQVVTLNNVGSGTLNFTGISISGDFSQSNTCGNSIAGNTSCTLTVYFKPTAANTRTGTLTINDNAPGSPQLVSLTGTGTYLTFSTSSINFGTLKVGKPSATKTVVANNHGSTALSINSIAMIGPQNQDFTQTNTCGSSIRAGKTCNISLTFTPSATGTRSASLAVSTYQTGALTQYVSLTGTGD
jgi:hypothetical protein